MEEFELEPGETVTRTVHQHPFLIALRFIPYIVLAALPLVILPIFNMVDANLVSASTERFILGAYWLFIWLAAFRMITKFFLTLWVITSHRIVDITQYAFFDRRVSSFLLARIQDITTDVEGFLPTFIGYGTLNVETAGRDEKFCMNGIAHPEEIRDLIMREIAALQNTDSLGQKVTDTAADALA
ncbi:MAG TPA: PH domain-containing protein [Candidatus Paceibacterota bacterium]|jgi:hypothetical protein|nr:PH domain-containing protein [Candidatus Paceibacterota bacterium]